jgi:hypothetical protein
MRLPAPATAVVALFVVVGLLAVAPVAQARGQYRFGRGFQSPDGKVKCEITGNGTWADCTTASARHRTKHLIRRGDAVYPKGFTFFYYWNVSRQYGSNVENGPGPPWYWKRHLPVLRYGHTTHGHADCKVVHIRGSECQRLRDEAEHLWCVTKPDGVACSTGQHGFFVGVSRKRTW